MPDLTDADKVAILTRALRFYADPKHWTEDDWGILSVIVAKGLEYGAPGTKARNALRRGRNTAGSPGPEGVAMTLPLPPEKGPS